MLCCSFRCFVWVGEDIESGFQLFEVRARPEDRHIPSNQGLFGDVLMLCVIKKNSFAKREDRFYT